MAVTEGLLYRAIDGREVGRDRVGAVGAGDAAKPATQEALDWGTCLRTSGLLRASLATD